MHRTTLVLMSRAVVVGLALCASAPFARAQGIEQAPQLPGFAQIKEAQPMGPKDAPENFVLVLPKDSTRTIEMSTREIIAQFRSENPKICKANAVADNPRAILLTGIAPGTTRVYLTDRNKVTESLEVRVPPDDEAVREQLRRDLLEQIRKAVPTAVADVLIAPNNTVILSGTVPNAENVQVIIELARAMFGPASNVVNGMRVGGVQQVQLDVIIARVNRSEARNLGFSWLNTGQKHFLASTVGGAGALVANNAVSVLAPAATLASTPNAVFGIFNDKQGFVGYLNALRTEGLAKFVAEPKVVTLSGRPAYIADGGETPILTSSGQDDPTVTYKTFGTVVNFLPIVLGNGKIHLEIRPEVSNLNAAAGINITSGLGQTSVPGFDIRLVQVAVQIEDGQTLAIGGLIQNSVNSSVIKVPILGDLPFLGTAFSSKTSTEIEEELIILVTPHLVDPMACNQLPKYLPGQETRNADDFELFLEGILEAPRGQRTTSCLGYKGAWTNAPAGYPCNDATGMRHNNTRCSPAGCGPTGCGPVSGTVPANQVPTTNPSPANQPAPMLLQNEVDDNIRNVVETMLQRDNVQQRGVVPATTPPITNRPNFGPGVISDR